ncbi:MAG: SDR family NAD(P)-dependent oxidoreductase [Vicingaceae bacterium]
MKKILISAASKGLGKAMAIYLAKSGYELILCSRNIENLLALKNEIKLNNLNCTISLIAIDLTDQVAIQATLKKLKQSDYPDVIINNLGVYEESTPSSLKISDIQSQMELNIYAAISLTNFFIEHLKRKKGQILNIGSVVSHRASKEAAAYSISKHALKAWNDCLREEMRDFGIKVTAIYPGAMNTSSWDGVEQIKKDKMIQAEDVAALVNEVLQLGSTTLVEEIRLSPLNFN